MCVEGPNICHRDLEKLEGNGSLGEAWTRSPRESEGPDELSEPPLEGPLCHRDSPAPRSPPGLMTMPQVLTTSKHTSAWLHPMEGLWGPGGHAAFLTPPASRAHPGDTGTAGPVQAMGGRTWGLEPQDHQPAWASPELGERQWRRWHFYWGQAGLLKICKRQLKNLVTP